MAELGDIVELKEPYKSYSHGGVAEIVSICPPHISDEGDVGIVSYGNERGATGRNVSLYLYKSITERQAELLLRPNSIPEFVDYHVCEPRLVKWPRERGYAVLNIDLEGELQKMS